MPRIFLFSAAAFLTTLSLFPSALPAATLDDCFKQALQQSETLAEDHEAVYQARQAYRQAIAAVLPNVSLNYIYLRQDDQSVGATTAEFNPVQQNTATVTLTQPLFQGFAEYAALRDVKDSLIQSKDAHRWAAMQIYQDVAQAFFQVLSLEHSRELLDEQIKDYDKELKEEQYFAAIGRARPSDLETVQADKALLQASASQTDAQIAVEREVLAFLTGQDPKQPLESPAEEQDGPGDLAALCKNVDERPDVHAALMQDKIAEELVNVAHGSHWPVIDLLAHYYPNSVWNQDFQIQRAGINSSINWDAEISATLPLFEGGALLAKDREASSVKRQADLNLQMTRRQALSNLRTAWVTLDGDLAEAKADQEGFRLAYKAYQDIDTDYRNGLDTIQDVMINLTAAWVAKQALENARYNARNDYEQLQTQAGRRLDLYPDPDKND